MDHERRFIGNSRDLSVNFDAFVDDLELTANYDVLYDAALERFDAAQTLLQTNSSPEHVELTLIVIESARRDMARLESAYARVNSVLTPEL